MTIDASNPGQRRSKEGAQSPGWERFLLGGSLFSNNGGVWTYGPDTADFLVNLNAKASGDYSWRCNRLADDPNKIGYAFAHRTCTGAVATGKQLCPKCLSKQYQLYEMCPSLLMTDFVLMCEENFSKSWLFLPPGSCSLLHSAWHPQCNKLSPRVYR